MSQNQIAAQVVLWVFGCAGFLAYSKDAGIFTHSAVKQWFFGALTLPAFISLIITAIFG